MTVVIDITTEQRKTLLSFLRRFIPGVEVWAYGSRVKWTARPNSDLDLVAFATPSQHTAVSDLKEAIAESNVPFLVDLHIWDEVPERFREIIKKEYVVFQAAEEKRTVGVTGEWEESTLGECAEWLSGGTPFKGNDAFWSGSIPWVSAKDMKSFRLYDTEDHISSLAVGNGGKVVPIGTILLLVRGMTLHNDVPICMVTREMAFNQDIKALLPAENVDGAFLAYWLLAHKPDLLASVDHAGHGTGRLVTDTLKGKRVRLPPLAKQKAIAAVLGSLDDKIELNRRMNATLEAMARALFRSWFVDFAPVRAKLDGRDPVGLDPETAALFPDSFQESKLGHIPKGWHSIPLYDSAQWVNGAAFRSEDFCASGDGLPVIKIAELKDGISAQTKWCQRGAGPNQIIDTGDLLYSWSGSPDTSLEAFLWSGGRGLLNQHIFKVIAPTAAEKRFVYYLLQYMRPVLVETARNKQTTGLGHVTIADMKRLLVCWPSKEVLTAFDRKIAPIFDKAFTDTLESRTLATLRDTLLPKLLSGELSVAHTQ